jgi:multiple antibiotic resistance protein
VDAFINSASLLYLLLNPLLMSVYLTSLVHGLDRRSFAQVMLRAHVISFFVFSLFSVAGNAIFESVFQVRFASFLIFGGMVFLVIGLRSLFAGTDALVETRGAPAHVSGAVAMPFMIGPGTVSASVLAGSQLSKVLAISAIGLALVASFLSITLFKDLLDHVRRRSEELVGRYIEVSGRIVALFTGTFAVEMIVRGIELLLAPRPG